jgi:hypothetical protein
VEGAKEQNSLLGVPFTELRTFKGFSNRDMAGEMMLMNSRKIPLARTDWPKDHRMDTTFQLGVVDLYNS